VLQVILVSILIVMLGRVPRDAIDPKKDRPEDTGRGSPSKQTRMSSSNRPLRLAPRP
jgi:hypothetical protein